VSNHQRSGDRQPHAGALCRRYPLPPAIKLLKDERQVVQIDTRAIVLDAKFDLAQHTAATQ
jgi:hypothetical protein